MNKIDLKTIFTKLQEQMTARFITNRSILPHPVTKGDATEINWLGWLKTYLPKRYSADKAMAIDSNGTLTEQLDIVIYDQQYSPFVFNQDSAIYIPAESIYAVFEVKQDLKYNIEYAGKKVASVRNLYRTSVPTRQADGKMAEGKPPFNILGGILTIFSSWSPPLGESLKTNLLKLEDKQKLNLGCSIQDGAFKVNYDTGQLTISTKEETLICLFFNLLSELHQLGTAPAIDINAYAKSLDSFQ